MSQSLARIGIHLVFSTKDRRRWINDTPRPKLCAYLAGIFQHWDSPAISIGGHVDHIHVLFMLSKNHSLAKVVEEVKKGSSKWVKTQDGAPSLFRWQNGYGAFSVSKSNLAEVKRYIERQAEHHRRMSFQDELCRLLERHQVAFDEQHLWS